MSQDPDLKAGASAPVLNIQTLMTKDDIVNRRTPFKLETQKGTATVAGNLRVDEDLYQSARLKFEYRPDMVNQPELKMIPVPGGANYLEAKD